MVRGYGGEEVWGEEGRRGCKREGEWREDEREGRGLGGRESGEEG